MDQIRYFKEKLAGLPLNPGNEVPVVVIIGGDSPYREAAAGAAAGIGAKVILPKDGQPLHEHKRALNARHCDCLMYSPACASLAYRIRNDGVTCVHRFIALEP